MDILSLLIATLAIVGGTVSLRVFFTLWGPIDRRLNGKAPGAGLSREVVLSELTDVALNVRFTSGTVLENVMLTGRCTPDLEKFYELDQMLILQGRDGREYFVRTSEIEYFEQARPAAPPSLPPTTPYPNAPGPDEPETWR